MNIKTAAIIQARHGSSRFPGKVLEEINGKPLLQIQLERLRKAQTLDGIIVATTGSPADDAISQFCRKSEVPLYRGSEKDVLDRYYQAAKQFGVETVVRITADCPLIDPAVVDNVVRTFQKAQGRYDFVANTAPPPGLYPDGMDVEVFSFTNLSRAWREAEKLSEREHVTFYFWKNPDLFKTFRVDAPEDLSHLRLTVDYPDDLKAIRIVYENLTAINPLFGLPEIVTYLKANPDALPKRTHISGEGWNPSLQKDASADKARPNKAPALSLAKTEQAWTQAIRRIPGGAQTFSKAPHQYVNGVAPKMLARGKGSRVWDLDGNEYIDYTLGLGPAILGHSHPEVNRAAAECADNFVSPPLPNVLESELAEKISALIPSAEMVRFGKNGSDVTAGAVRLARAFTGRDIVACSGYHGWQDWYIGSTSRRRGVPKDVQKLTKTFQYNQLSTLEEIFKDNPNNVAAVILEPVTFQLPEDDFLQKVRDLCTRQGALLIFDEIITGFRLDIHGAQGFFGVRPDLSTFGKAMANGYPLSVLCGKKDVMKLLEEVFFSFTFGGELPSIAAALKTIEIMERDKPLAAISAHGKRLRDSFNHSTKSLGITYARCIGLDFWPDITFDAVPGASALELLTLFQQEIVRRGILTRAALFISAAHGPNDIRWTAQIFQEALAVVNDAVQKDQVRRWIDGDVIVPVIRPDIAPKPVAKATRS